MIIESEKNDITSSGVKEEINFGTSDMGFIFDILRSKLYSNKVEAICKEISANGRDSMRAAGKAKTPIEITLPSQWQPNFKVKDTGEGMSPERVKEVYVNYGSSTKRGDNLQTGGWGIGGKTPWALSDSFIVKTIYDGILYEYSAYVDESKIGKLALLSKTSTDQCNGTEVIVPVSQKYFSEFERCIELVTRYWDDAENSVRPIIHGGKVAYNKPSMVLLEDDNWKLYENTNRGAFEMQLIVDGIKYDFDYSSFKSRSYMESLLNMNGLITIFIKTGEVSLAANRETVHIDKKTEDMIDKTLRTISKDIKSKLEARMASAKDYWEACKLYQQIINTYYGYNSYRYGNSAGSSNLNWNGLALYPNGIPSSQRIYEYKNLSLQDMANIKAHSDILISKNYYKHALKEETPKVKFIINDLDTDRLTTTQIKKIMFVNQTTEVLQVISKFDYDNTFNKFEKFITFDKVTNYIKPKKNKSGIERISIYEFDKLSQSISLTSQDKIKADKNEKAYLFFKRDKYNKEIKKPVLNKLEISKGLLSSIANKFSNYTIYVFEDKLNKDIDPEEYIKNISSLEDVMKQNPISFSFDIEKLKHAMNNETHTISHCGGFLEKLAPMIISQTNLLSSYLKESKDIESVLKMYNDSIDLISYSDPDFRKKIDDPAIKPKGNDIKHYKDKIYKLYPLLKHINQWSVLNDLKSLADYINAIDANLDTQNTTQSI